jgi:hypothetical protein
MPLLALTASDYFPAPSQNPGSLAASPSSHAHALPCAPPATPGTPALHYRPFYLGLRHGISLMDRDRKDGEYSSSRCVLQRVGRVLAPVAS